MINIIGRRYYFFALSLLIIIPGLIIIAMGKVPLSIDFTGGTLLEVKFENGNLPEPAEVIAIYKGLGIENVLVQTTGEGSLVARSSFMDEQSMTSVLDNLEEKFASPVIRLRSETVGPTIGQEVAVRAGIAVALAAIAVVIYTSFAFRGVQHAFRYGVCAVIAMIHDVLIVISLAAIGGLLWNWQIDALFLTALLTVIGFSVQDKIVVFDRIRENSNIFRRLDFETLVNHSIIQTLQRSINTQLMTVEFMLLALALFGGVTLREFATILLVGLFSGTYSSIFIASPILVVWEKREWRNWFRPRGSQAAA